MELMHLDLFIAGAILLTAFIIHQVYLHITKNNDDDNFNFS